MSTLRGVDVSLALATQATLHTAVDPTTLAVGDFLPFQSESLTGRRQQVQSRALRRSAMRRRSTVADGTQEAGGSLEFQASQLILDKILPLATHVTDQDVTKVTDNATAAEKTAGIHRKRYTLVDGGRLVPFSAFVQMHGGRPGEGDYARRLKGCKVNTFTLASRVNEFLTLNLDIAGIRKELLGTVEEPVYPGDEVEYAYLFLGSSVKIKAGNMADLGELPVESVEFTLNHNLNVQDYRLGSDERSSLDEGVTEVTGSFTMKAGADSISGAVLNTVNQLNNDRAFLERLNLESTYAAIQLLFVDLTRPIPEGVTAAGTTATELVLDVAPRSVQAGDVIIVAGNRVRVKSVDTAARKIVLAESLGGAPEAGTVVSVPSHLRVTLPFVRLEEPDFNVRDDQTVSGTARFEGYDSLTIDHVCKLA